MKKIFAIIIMSIITIPSFGAPMCVADDTITIVLDPSITGTANKYDEGLKTWQASFPYGTISGIAKCSARAGDRANDANGTGTWSNAASNWTASLSDLESAGDGRYCWCWLQHPVASPAWVFSTDYGSASSCAEYCAYGCAYNAQGNSAFRVALFGVLGTN